MDGYTASIMLNGNLEERDFILLRTAATQNFIKFDDAKTLSIVFSMVYHGYLLKYKPYYKDSTVMKRAGNECFDTIKAIMMKFTK